MDLLIAPTFYLFMAMMVDCPPVPLPDDEADQIIRMAYEARTESQPHLAFETISVSKCIAYYQLTESPPVFGRTENVGLLATFPHVVLEDNYRERHTITCGIATEFVGETESRRREDCREHFERYMRYERFDHEIRLLGPATVDESKAFLDFLLDRDYGVEDPQRVVETMRRIETVKASSGPSHRLFEASFSFQGCGTAYFSARATKSGPLHFSRFEETSIIC